MQEVRLDRWPGGQLGPSVLLIYLHIRTNHKHIRGSSKIAPLNTTLREQISTQAQEKRRNKRKGKTLKVLCLDKVRKKGKRLHNNMTVYSMVYRENESIKLGKCCCKERESKPRIFAEQLHFPRFCYCMCSRLLYSIWYLITLIFEHLPIMH